MKKPKSKKPYYVFLVCIWILSATLQALSGNPLTSLLFVVVATIYAIIGRYKI